MSPDAVVLKPVSDKSVAPAPSVIETDPKVFPRLDDGTDPNCTTIVHQDLDREREFVFGTQYIDEQVAQFNKPGQLFYVIQDANYNLTGLTTSNGTIHQQYTYGPYGELLFAEDAAAASIDFSADPTLIASPFGFQTAWFDAETGLICIRHRCYDPVTGRWYSMEPYGQGMVLDPSLRRNGESPVVVVLAWPTEQFVDGPNLFQFVGNDPINTLDPTGMYEDEIDDLIDDLTGDKIYVLATLNEGARWASLGLETASEIALSLIPGYGIYEAYQAVEIIQSGRGGLMDYLTVGLGGLSGGAAALKALKIVGRAAKWTRAGKAGGKAAQRYRAFVRSEFRHNMVVRTGIDPPSNFHAHHVFPIKHERDFSRAGMNIHDPKFGAWWDQHGHQTNGKLYNDLWQDFFDNHDNPTVAQVLKEGRKLARTFGLEIGF
jgi:RHS repeat-associated protein